MAVSAIFYNNLEQETLGLTAVSVPRINVFPLALGPRQGWGGGEGGSATAWEAVKSRIIHDCVRRFRMLRHASCYFSVETTQCTWYTAAVG